MKTVGISCFASLSHPDGTLQVSAFSPSPVLLPLGILLQLPPYPTTIFCMSVLVQNGESCRRYLGMVGILVAVEQVCVVAEISGDGPGDCTQEPPSTGHGGSCTSPQPAGAPALGAGIRSRFIARYTRSTTWSQFGSENNDFENQFSLVKTQFVKYIIKLAC